MRSIFILLPSILIACQQDNNVVESVTSAQADMKKEVVPVSDITQPKPKENKEKAENTKQNSSVHKETEKSISMQDETIKVKTVSAPPANKTPSPKIFKKETEKNITVSQTKNKSKDKVLERKEIIVDKPKVELTAIDRILEGIESTYKSINSIDVDFEQTIHNDALDQELVQTGSMHILEPNYFLWDIQFPMEQQYYFDGSQLRVWNPMNQQLLITDNTGEEGDIASILNDLSSISKKYQVSLLSQNRRSIQLMAKPNKDTGCESIQLTLDSKTYHVKELTSVCSETGKAHISFGSFVVNKRTSPSIFTWSPPAGAEIISSSDLYD